MNLDLKPYYKDYKSLLFNEEIERMIFSLEYSTIRVSITVLTIFKTPSYMYLYNKTGKKTCFKLIN